MRDLAARRHSLVFFSILHATAAANLSYLAHVYGGFASSALAALVWLWFTFHLWGEVAHYLVVRRQRVAESAVLGRPVKGTGVMECLGEEIWFTISVVMFYVISYRVKDVRFSPSPDRRLRAHRRMLQVMLFCALSSVALVCSVMALVGLSWRAYAVLGGVLLPPSILGGYVCWRDYKHARESAIAQSVLET